MAAPHRTPALPDRLEVRPLTRPLDASVTPPGSKSYTNRALILAALAGGESRLSGALYSDDTRLMAGALRVMGVPVEEDEANRAFAVTGCDGRPPAGAARLFVGNSGTSARFLLPLLALGRGEFELDGVARMRERPIQPLIDALNALGGFAESRLGNGCPPVRVRANGLPGGTVRLRGDLSSQYFSGLLMSAPYAARGVTLEVEGELVSRPYLDVTAQAMAAFGATLENHSYRRFHVSPGRYHGSDYRVEPDASAASYFLAAAAITGGRVVLPGLGSASLQGDLGFARVLERMGCTVRQTSDRTELSGPAELRGVEVDMADLSDTAQTLAVVAPFASSPTRITGIGFIRRKETDRIAAVVRELNRLGVRAEEEPDGVLIHPGVPRPAEVRTYDDHRMAMSFAVLGLRVPGVTILDPGCVSKTFPDFFEVLTGLERPSSRAS